MHAIKNNVEMGKNVTGNFSVESMHRASVTKQPKPIEWTYTASHLLKGVRKVFVYMQV